VLETNICKLKQVNEIFYHLIKKKNLIIDRVLNSNTEKKHRIEQRSDEHFE